MNVDPTRGGPQIWRIIALIAVCAIVGWTGTAEGAWCGLSLSCLTYIPDAMIGGVLFAFSTILVAGFVVIVATFLLRLRLGFVTAIALVALMAVLGFLFGSLPGIHGQGP